MSIVISYLKDKTGQLVTIIGYSIFILLILFSSRILILLWNPLRTISNEEFINIIINGLRIDISSISFLIGIFLPLLFFTVFFEKSVKYIKPILFSYLTTILVFFVFFETITPVFILEFETRPNRLFVEYLSNFSEIFSMIYSGYKFELILTIVIIFIFVRISFLLFRSLYVANSSLSKKYLSVIYLILFALCIFGYRGTLDHRPINPAMISFSNDNLLNNLCLNSFYSVVFSYKQMYLEKNSYDYYGDIDEEIMLEMINYSRLTSSINLKNKRKPLNAYHKASYKGDHKNIVIILQESLGARYVGKLNGLPLTPELDKLMEEGWNLPN